MITFNNHERFLSIQMQIPKNRQSVILAYHNWSSYFKISVFVTRYNGTLCYNIYLQKRKYKREKRGLISWEILTTKAK